MKIHLIAPFILTLLSAAPAAWAGGVRETRVLFHAGERSILEQDVRARTVPQAAWDQFIMGPSTRFDLPTYRKGLYGAETIGGTSLYALYQFLDGRNGWLMAITVKAECLGRESTQGLSYIIDSQITEPSRFARWYEAHRAKYRALEPQCLSKSKEFSSWDEGLLYDLNKATPEDRARTQACTSVLNDYLIDANIKIAGDAANDASWYIRDRSCIENIKGSPDELFDLIVDQKVGDPDDEFIPNFFGDYGSPGAFFAGSTLVFFNVMAETTHLTPAALPALTALEKDLSSWIGDFDEKNHAFSLDNNADNPLIVRHLVRAAVGALHKGTASKFQAILKRDLLEIRKVYKAECDGKFGIPAGKVQSCASATEVGTGLLIRHLWPFEK